MSVVCFSHIYTHTLPLSPTEFTHTVVNQSTVVTYSAASAVGQMRGVVVSSPPAATTPAAASMEMKVVVKNCILGGGWACGNFLMEIFGEIWFALEMTVFQPKERK